MNHPDEMMQAVVLDQALEQLRNCPIQTFIYSLNIQKAKPISPPKCKIIAI